MRARSHAISVDTSDDMANAREGVVYFWAKIEPVATRHLILPVAKDNALTAASAGYSTYSAVKHFNQSIAQSGTESDNLLKKWAYDLVHKLFDAMHVNFNPGDWIGWVGDHLVRQIAPFIGDIVGGVMGLYEFGKALYQKVRLWWSGRKVELRAGHPQAIAMGIDKLVNNALLDGLYKVAKSAVSTGLKFVTMGVSSVVDAVVGIVEMVVRLIYTITEAVNMDRFIEQCKAYWNLPGRTRLAALAGDAKHFNGMFLVATGKAPVIAGITYNTHIAGDKMRFLKMYADDGSVINQSQFDAGCAYLERLRKTGRGYVADWGERLRSDDPVVKGLLKIVKHGKEALVQKKPWYKRLVSRGKQKA